MGGRGPNFQVIPFPLRGKIPNVEKANMNKQSQRWEIQATPRSAPRSASIITQCRYNKVVLDDADVDGSHIRTHSRL